MTILEQMAKETLRLVSTKVEKVPHFMLGTLKIQEHRQTGPRRPKPNRTRDDVTMPYSRHAPCRTGQVLRG